MHVPLRGTLHPAFPKARPSGRCCLDLRGKTLRNKVKSSGQVWAKTPNVDTFKNVCGALNCYGSIDVDLSDGKRTNTLIVQLAVAGTNNEHAVSVAIVMGITSGVGS